MIRLAHLNTCAFLLAIVGAPVAPRAAATRPEFILPPAATTVMVLPEEQFPEGEVQASKGSVYMFDFGLGESPIPRHVGHTAIDTFDANSDGVCFVRTQTSDGAYSVSMIVSWGGMPLRTGSSVDVAFYGVDAAMNFTELGTLSIDDWIARHGDKLRRSQATDPFLPAPGCEVS
jgi:hypothetical protein